MSFNPKAGGGPLSRLLEEWRVPEGAPDWLRQKLLRLIQQCLAKGAVLRPETLAKILTILQDKAAPTADRRQIIRLLKYCPNPKVAKVLLALWDGEDLPLTLRKVLAVSLAAMPAAADAEQRLETYRGEGDAELSRLIKQSLTKLQRDQVTTPEGGVCESHDYQWHKPLPEKTALILYFPTGASPLASLSIKALGWKIEDTPIYYMDGKQVSAVLVTLPKGEKLEELWHLRFLLGWGLAFPLRGKEPLDATSFAAAVTAAASTPLLQHLCEPSTKKPLKFRMQWAAGGRQRAQLWKLAQAVEPRSSRAINVTRGHPPWLMVLPAPRQKAQPLLLLYQGRYDPRFTYRKHFLPASSKPQVAALLAYLSDARAGDVVWDPFAGSGIELIERGKLGPYQKLIGTDNDARSVTCAKEHIAAADLQNVVMEHVDSLRFDPGPVDVILTNPPLGHRVAHGSASQILRQVLAHALTKLRVGGRVSLLLPKEKMLDDLAAQHHLQKVMQMPFDLGGIPTYLTLFRKMSRRHEA